MKRFDSIAILVMAAVVTGTLAGRPANAQERGGSWADYSAFISEIDAGMEAHLQAVAALGESLGREPGRMGQIGDSITESSAYFRNAVMLAPTSNETGHDYSPIRSWLSYHGELPADANSFYRDHGKGNQYGCQSGWKLSNAINAGHPEQGVGEGNGSTPGEYSWVLIMFGTNDIDGGGWDAPSWKNDYEQFVQGYLDLGVVPVVSTIPPEQAHVSDGRVEEANEAILDVAAELNVPYVDYYALVRYYQPNTWNGTLISSDGTHPSAGGGGQDFSEDGLTTTDGYAARTKLTFDIAERLRDQVFQDQTQVDAMSWGSIKAEYRLE